MAGSARATGEARQGGGLPGFASLDHLFPYLYCMLASTAILSRPVLGGALYMIGQVTVLFSRLAMQGDYRHLPPALRRGGLLLGGLSALVALGILLVYPLAVDLHRLWLVFALSCLLLLMSELAGRIYRAGHRSGLVVTRRYVRIAEMMLLTCGVAALLLFLSQPTQTAWYLLGGYALCCVFRILTLKGAPQPAQAGAAGHSWKQLLEGESLAQVNAYRVFRAVMMITITALQVTTILIYTYIGTTALGLFSSLLIAFVCALLSRWLTGLLLTRPLFRQKLAPSSTLLLGLLLWLLSLASFLLHALRQPTGFSYAALALCISGVTMAARALDTLEKDMRDVVRFVTGAPQGRALTRAHAALSEYAALVGGMVALLGLALITLMFGGSLRPDSLSLTAQPLLLLPALALVIAAIPAAFRLPMDRRVAEKTRTFLRLQSNGETNLPLQKQLEDLVIKVHRRRYGIWLVIWILRPFFYSRVVGADQVKPEQDTSIIFTCNHGELWGPIVSNLFIPFSFRPWVIDEIAVPDQSSTYLYNNTIKRQRWIPERLKWPATRLVTRFLKWVMRSIDSIPVYRDNPRALVNTFRETASAMEAGDNILIFPENPNDPDQEQAGYLREGIGEFFSGFAMAAQIYHQRTGKCAQFYPIYADKKQHTLTFGQMTRYDPDNPGDEKQRIANHLRQEMLRMAGLEGGGADREGTGQAAERETV
mgnify:CR=1 FL=1